MATVLAGAIVLTAALLIPFEQLLVFANAVTLSIFALIDLALWHLRRNAPPAGGSFTVFGWVPLTAAALAVALMLGEILI